jgi:hypothetical protein
LDTPLHWNSIRDWGFNGLAIIFFAIVICSLLPTKEKAQKKNVSVSAVVLAMFCAVLGNPDRIASLKFLGFEAQTRELTKTIDDAKNVTNGVRELAVAISAAIVGMTSLPDNGGAADTQPARIRDQNKNQLISILQSIGVSDSQLKTVVLADREDVIQRYDVGIFYRISSAIQKDGTQSDRDSLQIMTTTDGFQSPDRIVKFLAGLSVHDQSADELAQDFAHYMATGKQRRPEVWADRDEWSRNRQ